MHVLITGGAGFIGSNLVEHHLLRGDDVLVVDDLSTGAAENLAEFAANPRFRFEQGDIVTWKGLRDATVWADRVYNLAAVVGMFRVLSHPVEVNRVNIMGAERVLREASRAPTRPQVVLASSSSVYGHSPYDDLREDSPLKVSPTNPLILYALSKLTNELHATAYAEKHGVKVVSIRLFNNCGPRQRGTYGFVIPRFIQQALAGEPLTVFGDGTQTRSFCDVRDTIAMLDLLAGTPAAWGKVVNVGNDREITVGELAALVKSRTHSASPIELVPFAKAYGKEFDQIPQRRPVLDRMRGLIGYRHRWTLEDTIDDLVARFRGLSAHQAAALPLAAAVAAS
jgi:UDP-glucose 4-epimerase